MRASNKVRGLICGVMASAITGLGAQTNTEPTLAESDFIVQSWRTSEGLPANVILDIAQTPEGFLWLGTTHGLARFDGVRFDSYLSQRMPHRYGTRIEALDVDGAGRLWIVAEQKGLLAFQRGQLMEFHTNGAVLHYPTASVCSDRAGGVWMLDTRGNLARIAERDPTQIESVNFKLPPGAQLMRDGKGHIWATSVRDISGMVTGNWATVFKAQMDISATGANREGGLWLAMGGQLRRLGLDGRREEVGTLPWPSGATGASCLFEDRQGVVWVGTSSRGLFRWVNGLFTQVLAVPRAIKSLGEDAEGNLWVGTRGGGLIRVRKRVFHVVDSGWGLRNEFINAVTEDSSDRIWLATEESGLGWVEGGRWQPVGREQGWRGYNVFCLAPDNQDGVWLATGGHGLWHWQSNRFARVLLSPPLPANVPRCLMQGQDGRLWVVLGNGALFSAVGGTVQRHGLNNGLNTRRVRAIIEDAEAGCWAGDDRGGIWHLSDDHWREVRPPGSNTEAVRAMIIDSSGDLWVGTAGAGLVRLRAEQEIRIGRDQGLSDEHIEQMLLDDGKLWLGTAKGLFHVSVEQVNEVAEGRRTQVEPMHHGQSEGLPEPHFSGRLQPRSWRTRNGQLWFATANGAVYFNAGELATNPPPPQALVEEVMANGNRQEHRSPLKLRSDTRRLEFRFTAPSFSAPELIRFRYQLSGVDEDWVECGSSRQATYASVPFGAHVFRVSACNASRIWGPAAESVRLEILPYFWQTQWFAVAVGAILASGLTWGGRRATVAHLRRKLERVEQQRALEEERSRISQDIHDELGANLTSIGLLADMSGRHQANPEALARDLRVISDKARGTASAMDGIVWAVNPRNDSLDHFANYLGQFAKEFFEPTLIRVRLDFPAMPPPQAMSASTRHNLLLAVKEALNNVVRHAEAKEVRLGLHTAEGTLLLTVEDDGKGIGEAPTDPSQNGLANMRARVEKVGGSVVIGAANGRGTRIAFAVPLAKLNPE